MVATVARGPMMAAAGGSCRPVRATFRMKGAPPPVRLTRRGRIAVTGLSALVIGAASVALATAAQAAHTGAGAAGLGRHASRVMVRPGQSLWALAEAYDPNADPRVIIADITQLNSMTSDQLQPGEVLWVPRG